MYSLVVLMALGTAGEATDWGRGCGYGGYGGYGGYCGYGGYGGYCGYGYGSYCGYGYGGYCGYGYSCYTPCYSYCAPVAYCAPMSYGCPAPMMITPGTPAKPKKEGKEEVSTRALIVVNVPAGAKVTFDGEATTSTASQRTFITPELEPGSNYTYVIKAETMKDGKPVLLAEKKVSFKAGQTTEVTLSQPATGVASR